MSNKKYFWLKLHKDFFKSKEMKKLRKIAGGDTYTIIYLKLQLLSLEDSGKLFFEGVEETFAEELALEIDETFENVQATFMFLQKVGLLEMVENDELSLTHLVENIGSETPSASRKRVQRKREKQRLIENSVTLSQGSHKNVTTDIEKEKELDTEIEKDKNTPNPSKGNFPFISVVSDACVEYQKHLKALGKGYKKTDRAWELFCDKVGKMIVNHGVDVTVQQINMAIEGNWKTIYEPKANFNTASKPQELVNGGYGDWSNL